MWFTMSLIILVVCNVCITMINNNEPDEENANFIMDLFSVSFTFN